MLNLIKLYGDLCSFERPDTSMISIRKEALANAGIVKIAFDTRYINKKTYNPRRNLQNFERSEPFVSQGMNKKIGLLRKVKNVVDHLKAGYEYCDEWGDSYLRPLSMKLDNCLRVGIEDGEFSENQKSTSSIDYLEQLMYNRYRLDYENIKLASPEKIEEILLSKDVELASIDLDQHSIDAFETKSAKRPRELMTYGDEPKVNHTVIATQPTQNVSKEKDGKQITININI